MNPMQKYEKLLTLTRKKASLLDKIKTIDRQSFIRMQMIRDRINKNLQSYWRTK